jgi:hypothetical protein
MQADAFAVKGNETSSGEPEEGKPEFGNDEMF